MNQQLWQQMTNIRIFHCQSQIKTNIRSSKRWFYDAIAAVPQNGLEN